MKQIKTSIIAFSLIGLVLGISGGYLLGLNQNLKQARFLKFIRQFKDIDSMGNTFADANDPGKQVDFGNFWKAWQILDENFVPVSSSSNLILTNQTRVSAAISGLANSYNDPFTVFIPKDQAQVLKDQVNGEFEGIGAVMNQKDGATFVAAIVKDSPSQAAGLLPDDSVIAVNGNSIIGQPLSDIVGKIRGPKGSTVTLTLMRPGQTKEVNLTLTRGIIVFQTTAKTVVSRMQNVASAVKAAFTKTTRSAKNLAEKKSELPEQRQEKKDYFVLQLVSFSRSSTDAFLENLKDFAKLKNGNLIIDLRNNPGGYLDVAVDIASHFLAKDTVVVREKTGKSAAMKEYKSLGYNTLGNAISTIKIAVLVNKGSASAAEILAGALQDHKIASIVGEPTFGKGSVQNLIDLGDIGSLKITTARWFTPNGRTIAGTGLTPDILVNIKDPKYASSTDPILDAAIEALSK